MNFTQIMRAYGQAGRVYNAKHLFFSLKCNGIIAFGALKTFPHIRRRRACVFGVMQFARRWAPQ